MSKAIFDTLLRGDQIRATILNMPADQFAAYAQGIRSQPYDAYTTNPDLLLALRAVNERQAAEASAPMNVNIRDGARNSVLPSLPGGLQWAPLIAIGLVLLIAARL